MPAGGIGPATRLPKVGGKDGALRRHRVMGPLLLLLGQVPPRGQRDVKDEGGLGVEVCGRRGKQSFEVHPAGHQRHGILGSEDSPEALRQPQRAQVGAHELPPPLSVRRQLAPGLLRAGHHPQARVDGLHLGPLLDERPHHPAIGTAQDKDFARGGRQVLGVALHIRVHVAHQRQHSPSAFSAFHSVVSRPAP